MTCWTYQEAIKYFSIKQFNVFIFTEFLWGKFRTKLTFEFLSKSYVTRLKSF